MEIFLNKLLQWEIKTYPNKNHDFIDKYYVDIMVNCIEDQKPILAEVVLRSF